LNQAAVAEALGITQQFLSQVETGVRNVTLDQRQGFIHLLGIPAEELGLAGRTRGGSALHEMSTAVSSSRGRWRVQRHWLNRHRSELGKLAAQWHAAENRLHRTTLITGDGWLADHPSELQSLRLRLDEHPQSVHITGAEPETLPVRPLRTASASFETYSSAVKHLDPPQLFESRPSYRYLGGAMSSRTMDFGLAAYFDKLDVSEALAHELAAATMNPTGSTTAELRGKLPFRELIGDPFDTARRAIIPAITTLTLRWLRPIAWCKSSN
jgi:transcriptional regulator with XRE-family HTH domain